MGLLRLDFELFDKTTFIRSLVILFLSRNSSVSSSLLYSVTKGVSWGILPSQKMSCTDKKIGENFPHV
jgi:hypothetical protein